MMPILMTRILIALGLFALLGCSTDLDSPPADLFQSGDTVSTPKSMRYLALGDSYTIGQGVQVADRWPVILSERLRAQGLPVDSTRIIARTGWTTANLLQGIATGQPGHDQDLVSLLIGVNNEYQYRPIDEYEMQFRQCLDTAIALAGGRKARVFVVSIPDYGYTPFGQSNQTVISGRIDAFNEVNRTVTAAYGIRYFDITPSSRQSRSDWVASDGLHPSGAQYSAWVDVMLEGVATMLR
jgi:lysophospholipase L1-like esterase